MVCVYGCVLGVLGALDDSLAASTGSKFRNFSLFVTTFKKFVNLILCVTAVVCCIWTV